MHSFDPKIASLVGVNAAVLYQNIVWWCAKNAANGHNEHEGRFWTYNSVKAWAELFPYLTAKQIRTALGKLEESGLILTGTFNQIGYDRTKWYCPSEQIDLPLKANGNDHEGEPIPDSKPVQKPLGNNSAREVEQILSEWTTVEAARSFIAYRRKHKAKSLSVTAAKRLAKQLAEIYNSGGDTADALGLAEERGWQTVNADWYFKATEQNNGKRTGYMGRGSDADAEARIIAFAARTVTAPRDDCF